VSKGEIPSPPPEIRTPIVQLVVGRYSCCSWWGRCGGNPLQRFEASCHKSVAM